MPSRPKTFESARYQDKMKVDEQARNRARADRKQLYNSAAWQTMREVVLSEQPICMDCGREPAIDIDHIVPLSKGGARLDRKNLQGLCKRCHTSKTTKGE